MVVAHDHRAEMIYKSLQMPISIGLGAAPSVMFATVIAADDLHDSR
jgi:hypothetical protein